MTGTARGRIWVAAAAVAAGVVAGGAMPVWAGAVLTVAGGVVVMLRRRPVAVMAGIGLVGAGAGLLSASVRATEQSQLASLAATIPRCEVKGRIVEQLGGLGTMVALERADCTGSALLQRPGNVVLDAPAAHPGAEMTAAGWLVPLGGGPFDTQRRRLGALAAFDADELNIGRVSGFLPTVAARIRGGLRAATATMDEKTAAILRGLSIGDVADIDPGTEESLRRAGLSHLVAVSGSNVAIVLGSVALACRRFGLHLRVGLAGAVLVIFVAVVGPEPSVLRAAFMGGIGLTAIAAGHRADPLHGLGLVVIALLCLRPGMAYSIGLHLSAAATAGIVLWTGPLRRRLRRVPDFIAAPLAATVAAQVAVAPLLVLRFGEISMAAPAANVLAFPAVPIGTILGLLSGLLGAVSPWLGSISARAAAPAAAWILGVGDWLGNEPWASTALPTWGATLLAAPVVLAAVFSIRRAGAE